MKWLVRIMLVCLIVYASCGCAGNSKKNTNTKLSIKDMLTICDQFLDASKKASLYFNIGQEAVLLKQIVSPMGTDENEDILTSENVTSSYGRYYINEGTREIKLIFGENSRTYIFFESPNSAECILVSGTMGQADLQSSWFAEPDFTQND